MKYPTFSKSLSRSAFALTAVLVAAACASSEDLPAADSTPTDPAPAAKVPASGTTTPPPAATTPPVTPPPAACKANKDCPAVAGTVQCCDVKATTCYGTSAAACPPDVDADAGDPAPAY